MYIFVPLIIIAVSASIIVVIIGRKFPYLKKLPVEAGAVSEVGLLEGFLPEIYHFFKKIDLGLYRDLFFKELEKFLRRLRVVSLRIDSFTKYLIDKIRINGVKKEKSQRLMAEQETKEEVIPVRTKISLEEKQKQEEHALIIEIAKNPKSPELYKRLADLYILMENFPDATEVLETALKLDPEDKKTAAKLRAVQKALPTKE